MPPSPDRRAAASSETPSSDLDPDFARSTGGAGRRPNFIVVLTDDQGSWTRSAPEVVTPTIDALAAAGTELTGFHCVSPVCSPARASLLTGLVPSAHGVHDWIRGDNSGRDTRGVHYLDGLNTTPATLARHGYVCAHSGKWHLGDARVPAPGFTHWFAHRDGGGPYFGAPVIDEGGERTEPGYVTYAITDHAVAMLGTLLGGPEPFYLQVNYTAPHSPWGPAQHPDELLASYDGCDFPSVPREPIHPWMNTRHDELMAAVADPVTALRGYCAALTAVDQGLRALLAELARHPEQEAETYVIFHSDNGFSCGHHGYWGKGNGTTPLNAWDPSVRVPFVVRGPGVPAGRVDDALLSALSLHATLLDLAGVEAGELPEASFAGRLLGDDSLQDESVVVHDEYGGMRMIRTRVAKLVVRFDGPDELYVLTDDPDERDNRIDDPALVALRAELEARLAEWFAARVVRERDGYGQPVAGYGQNSPLLRAAEGVDLFASAP